MKKKKKERERGKENKTKQPCTAWLLLSPFQSDMVFGLLLSFHSLPLLPAGGWNLSREQGMQSRKLQYFLQEKKKKACFNPCCKQSPDSLCWLSRTAKQFLQQSCCRWNWTQGTQIRAVDYFLSFPPSTPHKSCLFFFLPSCKVSHTAKTNTEDHGREERTKGGRKRKTKIKADGRPVLVKMEQVCPRCFQNLLTYESQMNPRPGPETNLLLLGGHGGC